MAFSLRSFFGKDKSPETQASYDAGAMPHAGQETMRGTSAFTPTPNPFSNGSIFKTAGAPPAMGQPVASPFSPAAHAGAASAALTVGDILPLLPKDVARNTQLPPGQPLQISEEVLIQALKGGHAALPLFEVYRVCPALFQTPISPQDPRSVPLPPQKIPALLPAGAMAGMPQAPQPAEPPTLFNPSPFGGSLKSTQSLAFKGAEAASGPGQPFMNAGNTPPPPPGGLPSPFQTAGQGSAPGVPSPFMPAQGVTVSTGAFPPVGASPPPPPPVMPGSAPSPFGNPFPPAPNAAVPAAGVPSPFAPAPSAPTPSPFTVAAPPPPPVQSPPPPPSKPFGIQEGSNGGAQPSPFSFTSPPPPPPVEPQHAAGGAAWMQGAGAAPSPGMNGAHSPFSTAASAVPPPAMPDQASGTFPQPQSPPPPTASPFSAAPSSLPPWEAPTQAAPPPPSATQSMPWDAPGAQAAKAPTALPPRRIAGQETASVPAVPASPYAPPDQNPGQPGTSPFARIAAMVGKPQEPAAAADIPPAPVNPDTPDISAFGRSFDLPAPSPAQAQEPAARQPFASKPFGDGVSFGTQPMPQPAQVAPPPVPAESPARDQSPMGDVFKLGLASLVRSCSVQDIGIAPDLIPSWVQASIPQSLIRPQLPTGKVTLTLAEILRGLEPEMRHLIVPAHPNIKVEVPISEVMPGLAPVQAVSPVPAPVAPPPMPKAEAQPLPAGMPWPFEVKEEPVAPLVSAVSSFNPASFPPVAPVPAPIAPTERQGYAAPPPMHFDAEASNSPFAVPAGQSVAANSGPAFPRVARHSDKHRQMLLRVLLGSQVEDIDADAVVRLTIAQPGVAAAVCFLEGKPVAKAGNGSPEADTFLRQAQSMHDHMKPLVALTGIEETETVSVKSDRHMVTFSLQGSVTLGVLHDPLQQEAVLREKVTLIARELTGLLQAA